MPLAPGFNPLSTGAESRTPRPATIRAFAAKCGFQSPQHRGGVAHVNRIAAHSQGAIRCFNPLSTGAESRTRLLGEMRTQDPLIFVSIPSAPGRSRAHLPSDADGRGADRVSIPSAPGRQSYNSRSHASTAPACMFQSPQHRGGVAHLEAVDSQYVSAVQVSIPSAPGRSRALSRFPREPYDHILFITKFQSPQHRGGVVQLMPRAIRSVLPRLGHVSIPSTPGRSRRTGPKQRTDGPDELLFQSPQHRGGVAHGAGGRDQYWPTDFPFQSPQHRGGVAHARSLDGRADRWTASVSIPSAPGRSRARHTSASESGQRSATCGFQSPQHRGGVAHTTRASGRRFFALRFNPLSTGAESAHNKMLLVTGVVT